MSAGFFNYLGPSAAWAFHGRPQPLFHDRLPIRGGRVTSKPMKRILAKPERIYITRRALQTIRSEAERHRDDISTGHETGGVLFGRRLDSEDQQVILIVEATGPGANAFHTATEFRPDLEYANEKLRELCVEYPYLDYIGTWHKHPSSLRTFSPGDVQTAHEAFSDPSYTMEELVNPIVWFDERGFNIQYYYMSHSMAEKRRAFEPLTNVVVIDNDDERVIRERGRAPEPPTEADATPQPTQLPERFADEYRRLLEKAYQVNIYYDKGLTLFTAMSARQPGLAIYFEVPSSYPERAVSVTVERDGEEIEVGAEKIAAELTRHSNTVYLADIADEIIRRLDSPSLAAPAQPSIPWLADDGYSTLALPGAAPPIKHGRQLSTNDPKLASGVIDETAAPPIKRDEGSSDRFFSIGSLWRIAGAAAALIIAVVLGVGFYVRSQSAQIAQTADAYQSSWQQIDDAMAHPSESGLRAAAEKLKQIQGVDAKGAIYPRNAQAAETLALIYVKLGDLARGRQPPDLAAAAAYYQQALALAPNSAGASVGLSAIENIRTTATAAARTPAVSLSSTALALSNATAVVQALAQDLARRWKRVDDAAGDPAQQLRLIEALRDEGVSADPQGRPIAGRLHDARAADANQLLSQGKFDEARAVWESALQESDDAVKRDAADMIARIYIAQGQAALANKNLFEAATAFSNVALIDPPPSQALLDQAAQAFQNVINNSDLGAQNQLAILWNSYDHTKDISKAIGILDDIIAITGPTPNPDNYPSPPHDPRTPNVVNIQAQRRLDYAEALQQGGNLQGARIQYQAIAQAAGVRDDLRKSAAADANQLETAAISWGQVNAARRERRWRDMLQSLQSIERLSRFGADARNPQGKQPVKQLEQEANNNLNASPTAVPVTATAPPPPSATPTAVPPPTYQVAVTSVSETEMQLLFAKSGGPCDTCNGYLAEAPAGLKLGLFLGGQQIGTFSSDSERRIRFGLGQIQIKVLSDPSGSAPVTEGGLFTAEAGGYYKIVIRKLG